MEVTTSTQLSFTNNERKAWIAEPEAPVRDDTRTEIMTVTHSSFTNNERKAWIAEPAPIMNHFPPAKLNTYATQLY